MPSKGGVAHGTNGIYHACFDICHRLHSRNKKEITAFPDQS